MISEVTEQRSCYQEACTWIVFFLCVYNFFAIFLQIFPSFLFLSLSSYFPLYCAFVSYFGFGLACSPRQAGLLKKDKVKVNFQKYILNYICFLWHSKASGELPVCV